MSGPENKPILMAPDYVDIAVDELLRQLGQNMIGKPEVPVVHTERITTWHHASEAASTVLQGNNTEFSLIKRRPLASRRAMQLLALSPNQEASSNDEVSDSKYRTYNPGTIPACKRPSPKAQKKLRQIAKEILWLLRARFTMLGKPEWNAFSY